MLLSGLPLGMGAGALFGIRNPGRAWLMIPVDIGFAILADVVWVLVTVTVVGAAFSAI